MQAIASASKSVQVVLVLGSIDVYCSQDVFIFRHYSQEDLTHERGNYSNDDIEIVHSSERPLSVSHRYTGKSAETLCVRDADGTIQ